MFKQTIKLCSATSLKNVPGLLRTSVRSVSTETEKTVKWDLFSAVCLERHPIVSKPINEMEAKFQKLLNAIDFENSMKSDHELKLEKEIVQANLHKQGLLDVDVDMVTLQTAQDFQDAGDAELAAFKFGPRITEADRKNIKTSLERKLDKCLVLLVQQKVGKESYWLPPQGIRKDEENMREAAERVLKEICGEQLKVRIYGNAPMGFYKYVYPKAVRENGSRGAKVFYYLARYLDGSVPETTKHLWLDRDELRETLPEQVHKSVSMFLVPE